jgi:hypothetical protein
MIKFIFDPLDWRIGVRLWRNSGVTNVGNARVTAMVNILCISLPLLHWMIVWGNEMKMEKVEKPVNVN